MMLDKEAPVLTFVGGGEKVSFLPTEPIRMRDLRLSTFWFNLR